MCGAKWISGLSKIAWSAAVLWTLVASPFTNIVAAETKPPLRVGVLLPLQTPSGVDLEIGLDMARAEINAAGGVAGRQIAFIKVDDENNPTVGVAQLRRLIESEKVEVILGSNNSQIVIAQAPHVERANLAQFAGAGASAITGKRQPHFFASYYSATGQAEAMFRYVTDIARAKSMAILAEHGAQARDGAKLLEAMAKKAGVKVTGVESFATRTPDMTPQLLSLRNGRPEVLLFWVVQQEDVVTLLRNLKDLKWDIKISASGAAATTGGFVSSALGVGSQKNLHGTLLKIQTYCPGDPLGQGEWVSFLARLKAFHPKNSEKVSAGVASIGYVAVQAMKAAIEGSGSTKGTDIKAYLESHPIKVLTGTVRLTPEQHFLVSGDSLVSVQDADQPRADGLIRRVDCK